MCICLPVSWTLALHALQCSVPTHWVNLNNMLIWEINSATCMKIAFGKLLHYYMYITTVLFWFLFSHGKSVFVCSRSFYLLLNEKVFLIQYKCCIKTRFSRCSSQEFAVFMVIVWLCNTLNMLTLPFNLSREIFQGEIFLVMLLLAKIS